MNSPGSSVGQFPPVRRNQKTSAMQIRYVVYRSNTIFIMVCHLKLQKFVHSSFVLQIHISLILYVIFYLIATMWRCVHLNY